MPESYPFYHSLVEQLAAKVITRIAQDGVAMEDAIKESIHYADLDRQQVIHLCFTLQDYGLTANTDPKSYFYTPSDMGKAFPSVDNGYVVYANKKNDLKPVFAAVEELRALGFTSQEITDINPELNDIMALMDEYQGKFFDVLHGQPQEMQLAAGLLSSRTRTAQPIDVQPPTPDKIKEAVDEAPVEEPTPADEAPAEAPVEEPTAGGDETFFEDEEGAAAPAGGATVTISPSPEELQEKITAAPKWTVENILSIDKARAYYDAMKKDLEDIVLNDKITIGEELMQKYNEQRSAIDEAINKIDDAQKDTKKLEKKEDELESEYEDVPAGDVPTEGQIAAEEPAPAEGLAAGAAPVTPPPPAPVK